MSGPHTLGQEVDVVGEIIGQEYDLTVKQLRALCGPALLTEVVMAADEQLVVYHDQREAVSDEVFVLTHKVIDEGKSLVEKFTVSTSPPDLLGISQVEPSELERLNDRLIDLGCEGGHGEEIAELQTSRTILLTEIAEDFAPHSEVDEISKLGFAGKLTELVRQAKLARMTQEAETFHQQKKSA
jgi:glycerophosphoryl diester phosphodiesterase